MSIHPTSIHLANRRVNTPLGKKRVLVTTRIERQKSIGRRMRLPN